MILADCHVHSSFSSDSKAPMEHMIEKALELGLKRLCFTDHMDYDYPSVNESSFVFDLEEYRNRLLKLKEHYEKHIEIFTGIELGLQPQLAGRLYKLTDSSPFDYIIGSSHVVDHVDPYYPEYWTDKSKEEGIKRYFESILENCRAFMGFHVYGHLDYIVRYVPERLYDAGQPGGKADYSCSDYSDLIDKILKLLICSGKGIEINTAGLKYGLGYPHPKKEILKRYKELGGELITIGSDAHKPEHLCYDFQLLPEYLKHLGFKYYAVFINGSPVYEKL